MSVTAGTERLSVRVAEEVRVWMARRRLSGVKLAARINRTQAYVSRRLNGDVPFDIDDLANIAKALDISVTVLIPSPEGGKQPTGEFDSAPASKLGVPVSALRLRRSTPLVDVAA